jgi:ubiquinone/menaquinone biosynthesis C-methylase UbiE
VTRHVRLRELLVGVEGLALLRGLLTGTDEAAHRRIDEVRRIVADAEADTFALGADVPARDVGDGYARWSQTYDEPGNPLIAAEQAVVWSLLDELAPGRALDAACGTGRHARRLLERGHAVIGVDATPEMLMRARERVPGARFERGDLRDLPLEEASVDLAVCALALEHLEDLTLPIAELARVVRPGGQVIVSDIHPVLSAIGGAPFFRAADGTSAYVRGHPHSHADYLDALAAAGLSLRRCVEPRFTRSEVEMQQPAAAFVPEAAEAAYLDLPAALIWDVVKAPAAAANPARTR